MKPVLSHRKLEAFFSLSQTKNFSRAAEELCLTQSALSQRISLLEDSLGSKLFSRNKSSVELTQAGHRLLHYCRIKQSLEGELLNDFILSKKNQLCGSLTIACFSSLMRSVVMPALAPMLRENPGIQIDFRIRDLRELPEILYRAEADLIINQEPLERLGYESQQVGTEYNVLIESKRQDAITDIYLDHDIHDHFNENYLMSQNDGYKQPVKRAFVSDIYGIIEGVRLGLGRGVVPLHMLKDFDDIQVAENYQVLETPCLLHYPSSPYYSELHLQVIKVLEEECQPYLNQQ
ncbi:MAG: LysR family transcriptional regulator [Kangiellaceae bacterium]|nr:LysR family transcriptional regulator [Kangiellaceae bacterium]MCW8998800.1 LysR family transcriptional regulator [Kangiellaceae bacterium]